MAGSLQADRRLGLISSLLHLLARLPDVQCFAPLHHAECALMLRNLVLGIYAHIICLKTGIVVGFVSQVPGRSAAARVVCAWLAHRLPSRTIR
jgi:hypothetical protein